VSRDGDPGAGGCRDSSLGVVAGRVLVVDDQENTCWILDKLLTARGHIVRTASSRCSALAQIAGFACQVAVVDYRLPDASGLDLLAALTLRVPSLHAILMTSYGSLELRASTAQRGGVYFDKPFSNELMIRAIEDAIVGAESCRQEPIPGIDSVAAPPPPGRPAVAQGSRG